MQTRTILLPALCASCFQPTGSTTSGDVDAITEHSSTTTEPSGNTTTEAGNTGDAASLSFRIDMLRLVDPHFFSDVCFDLTGPVNMLGLVQQVDEGKLNLVLHFESFDIDDLKAGFGEVELCDLVTKTCTLDGISSQTAVEQIDLVPCIDTGALAEATAAALNAPVATCLRTSPIEMDMKFGMANGPVKMLETRLAFNFDEPSNPQMIINGVLLGFVPRASAESVQIAISGDARTFWEMISPPAACVEQHHELLPSTDELLVDSGLIEGVWLAFNVSASRFHVVE